MKVVRASNGEVISLEWAHPLGVGGEAKVFELTDRRGVVAKLWHRPTPEHGLKVRAMLADPPGDPMAEQGHVSIAWPTDVLLNPNDRESVIGFLMPKVSGMSPIIDFYHPQTRRHKHPLFSYLYLLRTARNLASCVAALHARGYVIGDLNETNVMVSENALVTLIDTDSFQVPHPASNTVFRCRVGKPEFTPPELHQISFAWVDRRPEHDLFALSVLVFQLLMEGVHPFAGRQLLRAEPTPLEERIAAGEFPHLLETRGESLPMPGAPPFGFLPPEIQNLFMRCFREGHLNPGKRPDALTWQRTLQEAELSLATCDINAQHRHPRHLETCAWCERRHLLGGVDPFPSQTMVQQHRHLGGPSTTFRLNLSRPQYHQEVGYAKATAIALEDVRRNRRGKWVLTITASTLGLGMVVYWGWILYFLVRQL